MIKIIEQREASRENGGLKSRNRGNELLALVGRLEKVYIELGLAPAQAYRSALADFAPDYPEEVSRLMARPRAG